MVRSVKKRKLKDHCQLDHRNINQHMDYFKSTFGSAPMGNFVEEVNFDDKIDELVDETANLLNNDVNLNNDNENILLEEPSSIPSFNSINIKQSNADHETSNLPESNLYSSSSSPSDLGEVMLIDLPCPSFISNSTSKSNFNHINNHALPYQVDASTNVNHEISNLPASQSPILCSPSPSSSDLDEVMLIDLPCPSSISNSSYISNSNLFNNQSLPYQVDASSSSSSLKLSSSSKGNSLRSVSKRNLKLKSSNSSKSLLNYFKIISKSNGDLPISTLDENNSKDVSCNVLNSSKKSQSLHSKLSSTNNKHDLNLLVKQKKGNNSYEPSHTFSNMDPISNPDTLKCFLSSRKYISKSGNKFKVPSSVSSSCFSPSILGDTKNDGFELEEVSSSLIPKMIHREPKLKDGKVLLQSSLNRDNQNKWLSQFPSGLNMISKKNKMNIEQINLLKHKIFSMEIERDGNIGNGGCIPSGEDIPGEKDSGNKIQDDYKHESKKVYSPGETPFVSKANLENFMEPLQHPFQLKGSLSNQNQSKSISKMNLPMVDCTQSSSE
ncbi:hypothetical protein ROZALSC1DRAFT_25426, partial [Rozella allomycis CSF55]